MYFSLSFTPQILDIIQPLNESRLLKRAFKSNYFVDEDKYYYYLIMHEYLATFFNVTIMISVDTMYMKFVEHACGMFSILG